MFLAFSSYSSVLCWFGQVTSRSINEQGAIVARLESSYTFHRTHCELNAANRWLYEPHRLRIVACLYDSYSAREPLTFEQLQNTLVETFHLSESQELTSVARKLKYHLTVLESVGYVVCGRHNHCGRYDLWRNRNFELTRTGFEEVKRFAERFRELSSKMRATN